MLVFKLWFCSVACFIGFCVSQTAIAAPIFFGPTPYLSTANIPANFYASGSPTALEDFEDGSLDFGITVSGGMIGVGPQADSVDADDGAIDGSGSGGKTWFIPDQGNFAELTFTFPVPLPTAAGVVWTDGVAAHDIFFEAFGPGMASLGTLGPFNFADASVSGTTAEDRFFGVLDAGSVLAIRVRNENGFGGLEVDHVQFGTAVPQLGPPFGPPFDGDPPFGPPSGDPPFGPPFDGDPPFGPPPGVPPGDGNLNGLVEAGDYTIWANGFGAASPQFTDGDYNGDGVVNPGDFTTWANNFGQMVAAPEGAAQALAEPVAPTAVPEPSTLMLTCIGLLGLTAYGWRRRRRA